MANRDHLHLVTDDYSNRLGAALYLGGGGGTFDGMEARVAKLEQGYDKLRDDVAEVRTGLAVLTERVSHLPTKGFIVTTLLTSLAVVAALVLFQDRLTAFLGIGA